MIEQLPETVILLEHLRHRAHHAQFTACAAARANLAQGGFDPCLPCHAAPDADQHQQGKGDQREHPRPCGQVSNARVRKSQHSFRIAETFLAPEPAGILRSCPHRAPVPVRDQEPDAPPALLVARSGVRQIEPPRSARTIREPSQAAPSLIARQAQGLQPAPLSIDLNLRAALHPQHPRNPQFIEQIEEFDL